MKCHARGCPVTKQEYPNLRLFLFPHKSQRYDEWCRVVQIDPQSNFKFRFLCERHFSLEQFRHRGLIYNQIPKYPYGPLNPITGNYAPIAENISAGEVGSTNGPTCPSFQNKGLTKSPRVIVLRKLPVKRNKLPPTKSAAQVSILKELGLVPKKNTPTKVGSLLSSNSDDTPKSITKDSGLIEKKTTPVKGSSLLSSNNNDTPKSTAKPPSQPGILLKKDVLLKVKSLLASDIGNTPKATTKDTGSVQEKDVNRKENSLPSSNTNNAQNKSDTTQAKTAKMKGTSLLRVSNTNYALNESGTTLEKSANIKGSLLRVSNINALNESGTTPEKSANIKGTLLRVSNINNALNESGSNPGKIPNIKGTLLRVSNSNNALNESGFTPGKSANIKGTLVRVSNTNNALNESGSTPGKTPIIKGPLLRVSNTVNTLSESGSTPGKTPNIKGPLLRVSNTVNTLSESGSTPGKTPNIKGPLLRVSNTVNTLSESGSTPEKSTNIKSLLRVSNANNALNESGSTPVKTPNIKGTLLQVSNTNNALNESGLNQKNDVPVLENTTQGRTANIKGTLLGVSNMNNTPNEKKDVPVIESATLERTANIKCTSLGVSSTNNTPNEKKDTPVIDSSTQGKTANIKGTLLRVSNTNNALTESGSTQKKIVNTKGNLLRVSNTNNALNVAGSSQVKTPNIKGNLLRVSNINNASSESVSSQGNTASIKENLVKSSNTSDTLNKSGSNQKKDMPIIESTLYTGSIQENTDNVNEDLSHSSNTNNALNESGSTQGKSANIKENLLPSSNTNNENLQILGESGLTQEKNVPIIESTLHTGSVQEKNVNPEENALPSSNTNSMPNVTPKGKDLKCKPSGPSAENDNTPTIKIVGNRSHLRSRGSVQALLEKVKLKNKGTVYIVPVKEKVKGSSLTSNGLRDIIMKNTRGANRVNLLKVIRNTKILKTVVGSKAKRRRSQVKKCKCDIHCKKNSRSKPPTLVTKGISTKIVADTFKSTLEEDIFDPKKYENIFSVSTILTNIFDKAQIEQLCQLVIESVFKLKNANMVGSMGRLTIYFGQTPPENLTNTFSVTSDISSLNISKSPETDSQDKRVPAESEDVTTSESTVENLTCNPIDSQTSVNLESDKENIGESIEKSSNHQTSYKSDVRINLHAVHDHNYLSLESTSFLLQKPNYLVNLIDIDTYKSSKKKSRILKNPDLKPNLKKYLSLKQSVSRYQNLLKKKNDKFKAVCDENKCLKSIICKERGKKRFRFSKEENNLHPSEINNPPSKTSASEGIGFETAFENEIRLEDLKNSKESNLFPKKKKKRKLSSELLTAHELINNENLPKPPKKKRKSLKQLRQEDELAVAALENDHSKATNEVEEDGLRFYTELFNSLIEECI